MYSQAKKLIPFIPPRDYDKIATEFLELYYPQALTKPQRVPIENIAREGLGLDIQYVCLTEELDVFGMTIFTDGKVEIYDPDDGLYDTRVVTAKTVLIDPKAVDRTNTGCKNNTIAHECVHWYKHRYYYKFQNISLPKLAKFCKCRIDQMPNATDDESIMERQAVGIAPRILMPKQPFMEAAEYLGVSYGKDNRSAIGALADFYDVSKQSVAIRLKECSLL
jgi:hypothetical protein